jgi:hypothetical protein
LKCLSCWTREFTPFCFPSFSILASFLLLNVECFLLSDDDKPKKDVVVVPVFGTLTTPEGHSQE